MLEPQISINLFGALVEIDKIMFYVQTCSEETASTCPGVHNVPHRSYTMCKMLKSCHQNS